MKLILGLIILFPLIAYQGFVVSRLVDWTFQHTLSLPVACGLCLIFKALRSISSPSKDSKLSDLFLLEAVYYTLLLGMGFVVTRFI